MPAPCAAVLEILPRTLFQLAIRSGTREEFNELHESGRLMPSIDALKQALVPFKETSISPSTWTGLIPGSAWNRHTRTRGLPLV